MALVKYTNEHEQLRKVALYRPRLDEIYQGAPENAMYISTPDPDSVLAEFDGIAAKFQDLGVEVVLLEDDQELANCANMIFLRDVAAVIGDKIIPGKMKYPVRAPEPEKFVKLLLQTDASYESNIVRTVGDGTLEGADLFVMSSEKVVAYTGHRTSNSAIDEIASNLKIETMDIPANIQKIPQHLLGGMHIIASGLLARRPAYCQTGIQGFQEINLTESDEVTSRFAMNIVTLAPGVVMMPEDCPETREALEAAGVVCHTVKIDEIRKMGGGLACMTLPLVREAA